MIKVFPPGVSFAMGVTDKEPVGSGTYGPHDGKRGASALAWTVSPDQKAGPAFAARQVLAGSAIEVTLTSVVRSDDGKSYAFHGRAMGTLVREDRQPGTADFIASF